MSYSKVIKIAFAAVLGLCLFLGGTSVLAETSTATYDSKSDITFKLNEGPGPGVVDPEDPDKPVKPTDPDIDPGTDGPLSIDYVSNFHFGEQTITDGNKASTYYAELTELEVAGGEVKEAANFIQVTDARANGAGWHVDVKQNDQFTTESGQKLAGAKLMLKNPTLGSVSESGEPTAVEVNLDPTGEATLVINAAEDQGMGTWVTSFGKDSEEGASSVELELPANSKLSTTEQYKTTLTWVLTDAPK